MSRLNMDTKPFGYRAIFKCKMEIENRIWMKMETINECDECHERNGTLSRYVMLRMMKFMEIIW